MISPYITPVNFVEFSLEVSVLSCDPLVNLSNLSDLLLWCDQNKHQGNCITPLRNALVHGSIDSMKRDRVTGIDQLKSVANARIVAK